MTITFNSFYSEHWFRDIVRAIDCGSIDDREIVLDFAPNLSKSDLRPVHIVTYACLIQYLDDKNYTVRQGQTNQPIANYIYEELGLKKYWRGSNHEDTIDQNVFNLWRIVESEKDLYSKRVEEYFKRNYFYNKDLSRISLSLVEAFYNIFDHAKAQNNAFVHMKYDEPNQVLSVAIADLGLGIVNTVKNARSDIQNDTEALLEAIKDNFTISSTSHNRGKGLENILACTATARIISGSAMLLKQGDSIKAIPVDYVFPGSVLYFDIDLSNLEDLDYIDEFTF